MENVAKFLAGVWLLCALVTSSTAQCKAPRYWKGADYSNDRTGSFYIAMLPSDISPSQLECVGETLKKEHPKWESITVLVFTSQDAALSFSPAGEDCGKPCWRRAAQLHAMYTFDSKTRTEEITIFPLGYGTQPSLTTTIPLPIKDSPRCRLEVVDRCLIAAPRPTYPAEALKANISGATTIMGTTTADGRITGLQLQRSTSPEQQTRLLSEAALRNVAAWRLEPRAKQQQVQIKFSYIIDHSLAPGSVDVDYNLPAVVIRGNP